MKTFEGLERGDIVRHITSAETYVVLANYGDRITAVKHADMTNPAEWESVTAEQRKSKSMCGGCEDDFYNTSNSSCWSFASATIKSRKVVHIDDVPPWKHEPKMMLSCYHKKQHVIVDSDRDH